MPFFALFLALNAPEVVANEPRQALEIAIAVLEHQEGLMAAWNLEYRHETNSGGQGNAPGDGGSTYRELRNGARYRTSYAGAVNSGQGVAVENRYEQSFDGRQVRRLDPSGQATISSAPGHDVTYFEWVYLSKKPLSAVLRSIPPDGDVAWDTLDGRRVLRCGIPDPPHPLQQVIHTYWLDPDESWQPRQVAEHNFFGPTTYPDGRKESIVTNSIRKYLRKEGVILPADTERTIELVSRTGQRGLELRARFTLTKLALNPPLDDESFTLPFAKGTQVVDVDRQVVYIEGEPGSETPVQAMQGAGPAPAANGGQWMWWGDRWVWWTLAAVFFLALGWLNWRQRKLQTG